MKITTKTQHALRMMLDIASRGRESYISLKDVASRMNVSKTYLEQIMLQINKGDFLTAARGSTGGYKLSRPPDKCTVGDIMRVMEGGLTLAGDSSGADARSGGDARVNRMAEDVWNGLEHVMSDYLDNLTLQDIIDKHSDYTGFDYNI
jgi:Rrf2 family protein